MFHRHLSSSLRPCLRPLSRPLASTSSVIRRRGIASSLSRRAESPAAFEETSNETTDEDLLLQPDADSSAGPASYREFMEKIGHRFQYASPLAYLGDTVEFVLFTPRRDRNLIHSHP